MPVEVAGKTRARGLSLIQADIIGLRPDHAVEDRDHLFQGLDGLDQILSRKFAKCASMDDRGDEQVPGVVRKPIQNDDGMRPSPDRR